MHDNEKFTCRVAFEILRGLAAVLRMRAEFDPETYDDPDEAYRCRAAATDIEDAYQQLKVALER